MVFWQTRESSHTISIHVPREGDDRPMLVSLTLALIFQSTSPVRGTTLFLFMLLSSLSISIHVPREGDDLAAS